MKSTLVNDEVIRNIATRRMADIHKGAPGFERRDTPEWLACVEAEIKDIKREIEAKGIPYDG